MLIQSGERLPHHDVAGGQAAHQRADTVFHPDADKAELKGGLHVILAVVDENTLAGLEAVFVQQ